MAMIMVVIVYSTIFIESIFLHLSRCIFFNQSPQQVSEPPVLWGGVHRVSSRYVYCVLALISLFCCVLCATGVLLCAPEHRVGRLS